MHDACEGSLEIRALIGILENIQVIDSPEKRARVFKMELFLQSTMDIFAIQNQKHVLNSMLCTLYSPVGQL